MTSHRHHSSSSGDSSSASSRSSSPATAVPKAYARLENDSEQVQTLVDREKEKMYRKRPYSVSLSSGSELDLSPEVNIPKAYSRKKKKKSIHEDGNSWQKSTRVPSSSSSSSSSDSSSSSSSSSDSSSDSETEPFAQNQHKKNLSSKDSTKDNRSSHHHSSNNQNKNSSRKVHEGEKKIQQRLDKGHIMVAQSPEEIKLKKRAVEDKPRSSRHTDVARRSHSQEIRYRDSMSRGRSEGKTHRHRVDRELRQDQEPIRDESSKKNNHKERDFKRDGTQSEKDRRYYEGLKEMPRDEGLNSRRREEERYKGDDAQKIVHKSARSAHTLDYSQSRAKTSRERDRRKLNEVSKQGLDHERSSPAETHSRSKSKTSKEKERQRVKHESSVGSAGREYFSTERGCWEWEPLEEPSRKAPDDPRDQASHKHDRRQNSREGRTDNSSRHAVRESSHADQHNKKESLDVDSRRTGHSSVSPVKTKSDSIERRKRKMERAKEKERAKLKKEKRKRREKLERRKAKKKERREHRSKKSKEKRRKERKERRSKELKGPKISSIQAKLLNLAAGVQEPAPRILAPMTKEEYERKQSRTRRVYDEDTGRHRLVRGEGEIIEEIVSRDRHRQINKQATRGDGISYQRSLGLHRY